MKVSKEELYSLIMKKLEGAGLSSEHAKTTSEILVWSDLKGIHSHGAVRVDYYAERIAKKGINVTPQFQYTSPSSSVLIMDGDNGIGFEIAKIGMDKAIEIAKNHGVAVVGMKRMSHSGAIGYYTELAAKEGLLALSFCQSDPMVVPYGGTEPYYGTNPISFAAPSADGRIILFDMATTVQAWGKILDRRSKGLDIPEGWAVDKNGSPTTDPYAVNALLPIAGPKGYGLMMMVDILSGMLLGLPFGKHVSSMYHDLSSNRELGQMHIVFNPEFFTDKDVFLKMMSQSLDELKQQTPAPGFEEVQYPGEGGINRMNIYLKEGIDIADSVMDYLKGKTIHQNKYDNKNRFAE